MAKRLTDTEKWRKSFIKKLPAKYKLFWFYITDDCDHAGIWHVDINVASLRIGEEFNLNEIIEIFGDKIQVFDEGEKWFIPSFIEFQYGELNEKNRVHLSVIKELSKYNLIKNKPLISPLEGAKDKDKDKDKDMDKDKEIGDFKKNTQIEPVEEILWTTVKKNFLEDGPWQFKFVTEKNIPLLELERLQKEFLTELELREDFKDLKELKNHFTNYYNKNCKNGKFKNNVIELNPINERIKAALKNGSN